MNLIIILKYLLDKDLYKEYYKYINIRKDNKELSFLFNILRDLHEKYPERNNFTVEEFIALASARVPESLIESTSIVLSKLSEVSCGDDVLHELLRIEKEKGLALELALVAVDVSEGRKEYSVLLDMLNNVEHKPAIIEEEIKYVTDDLEELYDHNVKKVGLRWRLQTLNEMLGSLRRGDFGFIFARPESGKTTFLASEATFFAENLPVGSGPVIWFNNEEQGEKVQLRCYQAALGCDLTTLFSDRKAANTKYHELVGDRLRIIDNASIYKHDVERFCEKIKPSCIIFDQIDKIKGFANDREDLRLGSIYQWARELAKTYAPVIGVTQADGSGEGKRWLTMENVANAKTAKQAEADFILGIGKLNEAGFEYVRHLHLSKNKLAGDEDTIPELRHGRRDVIIRPEFARYQDVQ